MGSRQVVALGLRLFSVWLCIGAFQSLAMFRAGQAAGGGLPSWAGFAAAGVLLAAAWLIWMGSASIARGLMSGVPATPEAGLSAQTLLVAGCALLGLWWLKGALVPLIGLLVRSMVVSRNTALSAPEWLFQGALEPFCVDVVQLALGLFFVLRCRQVAQWILRRAQYVPEPSQPFDEWLARASQLGTRQTARPDILANLVEHMVVHPAVWMHLPELQSLLGYKGNRFTRGVAARVILRLGPAACAQASDAAHAQWANEDDPEVADLLGSIARVAGASGFPEGGAPAAA